MSEIDETEAVAPSEDELASFRQWQRDHASDEAKDLTEAGAKPDSVDDVSLLAQIQRLQEQMATMNAERGIPSDPIEARVLSLKAHAKAQADAHPAYDFSELLTVLDEIPAKSSDITPDDTALVKETVDDFMEVNGPLRHDLGYVQQLSRDFSRDILKARKAANRKAPQKANA